MVWGTDAVITEDGTMVGATDGTMVGAIHSTEATISSDTTHLAEDITDTVVITLMDSVHLATTTTDTVTMHGTTHTTTVGVGITVGVEVQMCTPHLLM